ncbi:hypothetical protein Tco_0825600 [Tanacetum coccineum]
MLIHSRDVHDEHTIDYSSPPLYDDVDDDLVELESDNDNVYDDPFDSKEDKIKESKLLIDELDPPRSSDFLPSPSILSSIGDLSFKILKFLKADGDFSCFIGEELCFGCSVSPFLSPDQFMYGGDQDCLDFEASRARGFCPSFTRASNPQLHFGNPISKSYRLMFIFKHNNKNGLGNLVERPFLKH